MEPRKQAIIDALAAFMNQRSGIEFGNYGDVKAFRAEQRSIYNDLKQARVLLAAIKYNDGITADDLIKASEGAFSGRLTITMGCGPQGSQQWSCDIDYTTGQYFVTEYRRAVCAVLASALWAYAREKAMPSPIGYRVESWTQLGKGRTRHTVVVNREAAELQLKDLGGRDYGSVVELYSGNVPAGDWLRAYFRKEFGRTIANRWFS